MLRPLLDAPIIFKRRECTRANYLMQLRPYFDGVRTYADLKAWIAGPAAAMPMPRKRVVKIKKMPKKPVQTQARDLFSCQPAFAFVDACQVATGQSN